MTALLLIDLQNDFFSGGPLAVPEAEKILPHINALIKKPWDLIVATQDWHPSGHSSFASTEGKEPFTECGGKTLWPDHCVIGSKGAEFHPGWNSQSVQFVVKKGTNPRYDSYSAFFDEGGSATGLHSFLKAHDIDALYVAGLATDYCVKFTVLDALALGYKVYVDRLGCQAVNLNPKDGDLAFDEMKKQGALL